MSSFVNSSTVWTGIVILCWKVVCHVQFSFDYRNSPSFLNKKCTIWVLCIKDIAEIWRCYITFLHLLRPTFWTSSPLFLQNPSSNKSHCFWIGRKWLIWMCFGENKKGGASNFELSLRSLNFLSIALFSWGIDDRYVSRFARGTFWKEKRQYVRTSERDSIDKKLLPKSYFMQGEKGYTFVLFLFFFYNVLRQHWIPLLSTFTLSFTVIVRYYGPLNNNVAFKKLTNQGDTQLGGLCTFEITEKKKKNRC